ncbi:MAG: hypothetical protein PWP31_981 [Clostridia bacterium]|nr:hypothetical protein [Clostridia bacterium]
MAFLGHLEMLRLWQRAMRRANLPLAYSSGFNPHPRIAFGSALAVGIESLAEYMDVELTQEIDIEIFRNKLQRELPEGLQLLLVCPIPTKSPALTYVINTAAYKTIWLEKPNKDLLHNKIEKLLAQSSIEITRRGKSGIKKKDIRPGIFNLNISPELDLEMLLQCSSTGSVRPEEVLKALDFDVPAKFIRTGLFIKKDDSLIPPENIAVNMGKVELSEQRNINSG